MAYRLSGRKARPLLSRLTDNSLGVDGASKESLESLKKEGLTMQDYDDFIRIMHAKKPSDVKDIPDDKLLFLLNNLYELSSCVSTDDPFTNGGVLAKLRSMKGVSMQRRVL